MGKPTPQRNTPSHHGTRPPPLSAPSIPAAKARFRAVSLSIWAYQSWSQRLDMVPGFEPSCPFSRETARGRSVYRYNVIICPIIEVLENTRILQERRLSIGIFDFFYHKAMHPFASTCQLGRFHTLEVQRMSSVEHPTVHFLCHFKTYRLLFFFRYDSNARYRIVLYKNCVAVSNWTNISAIKQAQYVTLSWLPIFAFWKHSTMLQNHRQMSYCNSKLNHSDHRHVLPVAQQVSFLIKLVRIDLV